MSPQAIVYVVTDCGGMDGTDRNQSIHGVFASKALADECVAHINANMYDGYAKAHAWMLDFAEEKPNA